MYEAFRDIDTSILGVYIYRRTVQYCDPVFMHGGVLYSDAYTYDFY